MKKQLLSLIAATALAFSAAACAGSPSATTTTTTTTAATTAAPTTTAEPTTAAPTTTESDSNKSESTVAELLADIYAIKKPEFTIGDAPLDPADPNSVAYYTGLESLDKVAETAVSESMIGSQAYSLVLLRVKDPADAEEVAQAMLDGINPAKWICVGADDLQIVTHEDIVLLIMVASQLSDTVTSQEIVDAFIEVRGAEPDVRLKK